MQPQEYTITSFKIGDFQDNFGNTWCDITLKDFGEPVKLVLKEPTKTKEGDTLYGSLSLQTGKSGKTYYKFRKELRPDGNTSPVSASTDKPGEEYWEDKNAAIRAQFAIKTAVSMIAPNVETFLKDKTKEETQALLESWAVWFYQAVDRVSGKDAQNQEKVAEDIKAKVDEVFPVDEEEPIDLNDIPY